MSARRLTAWGAAAVLGVIAVCGGAPSRAAAATSSARPTARLHVTVTLRPRDPAALADYAQSVSTPGSPEYGRYLTPAQFAARFGAGAGRIDRLRATLAARGLHSGHASAGGLSIPLTTTAAALRRAGPRLSRVLPRSVAASVAAVVGQSGRLGAHPLAVRAPRRARHAHHTRPSTTTGRRSGAAATAPGPAPCAAATAAASRDGAFTDDQLASAYGFDPLYRAGDEGQGTTIAVYELEPDDPADIAAFQSCYGTHADVSNVKVDGGAGRGAGSDEAAFDIENVIGFAPRARVLVYQGPNSNSGLPGSGPYDVFSAIVNQDRAQVVSVSWGQCEGQLRRRAAAAERTLFEQAAVQGQTIVAAAGDSGAEDCDTGGAHSSVSPAVDDPASQPDVIGVGGTTVRALGQPPVQTAWNSSQAGPDSLAIGAGGGGVSSWWAMPSFQFDTPARLHVHRAAAAGRACGQTHGLCREVPDVAADADPTTGYEVYWNGADSVPEPSGWQALGGTSGAAPLWAALFALADASPACGGSPLGEAGPALYRAASAHYAADFDDVTSGENDFTSTAGGRWPAGDGYDLATGLGTPDAAPLVADLCANSVRLSRPAGQSSALGAAVSLALHGHDVRGATLRYAARGLPRGVHIDARTGRMTGRPRTPGVHRVRAIVRDGRGSRASQTFTWVVGAPPRVTAASITAGRLRMTVRSGRHAPWLRRVDVRLPSGLRAGGARRIRVDARGRATTRVHEGVVTITLASPSPAARIAIEVDGRAASDRLRVEARTGSTGTSRLAATLKGAA